MGGGLLVICAFFIVDSLFRHIVHIRPGADDPVRGAVQSTAG